VIVVGRGMMYSGVDAGSANEVVGVCEIDCSAKGFRFENAPGENDGL
jgi:hypothetical protein